MVSPASPSCAVICFQTAASYGSPEAMSCRSEVSGLRSATNFRTESASASSSSVSISVICWPLLLTLRADAQLIERSGAVHAGVLGQPEHALADDVALDLAGAAGYRAARRRDDRGSDRSQLVCVEPRDLVAQHVRRDVAGEAAKVGPGQLGHRAASAWRPSCLRLLAQQEREQLDCPPPGVQLRQLAPDTLVCGTVKASGEVTQ